ncbi:MAG: hypothetical protein U9R72_14400 [Chloroflexota bacterium]|nr:hypothetical protein [Chloroflexota bacterium]
MGHPFEVGGTYRNRHGEYEVVEIDGPDMVIRYSNGRRLETTVKLQARIWKSNTSPLFTPHTRHREQIFEYGSRVLDLCHEAEIDKVRRNVDAGKWLVWDKTLYANNFLIVKTPIRELPVKPPIEVATNLLGGAAQGEPVGAVSIPAPKALDPGLRHLLEDL